VQGVIEGKVVELVAFCCASDIMIVDKAATVEILCVASLSSLQVFENFCKGGPTTSQPESGDLDAMMLC